MVGLGILNNIIISIGMLVSIALLGILVPVMERRIYYLRNEIKDYDEKIEISRLNFSHDSAQKIKMASVDGARIILDELGKKVNPAMDALKELLIQNISALSGHSLNISKLRSQEDLESLGRLQKELEKKARDKANLLVKNRRTLLKALELKERQRFNLYLLGILSQVIFLFFSLMI